MDGELGGVNDFRLGSSLGDLRWGGCKPLGLRFEDAG